MSPRNTVGTYSLPTPGNPVVSGQVVNSVWANTTLADIAAALTDSASRTGAGNFTAPVRTPDGTVAAPAHAFTSETTSGLYRAGAGDLRLAVGGVDALKLVSGGVNGPLTLATGTTSVQVTVSGGFLLLQGNRVAADITLADVVADSSVTRTAGNLFGVRNNGTAKLLVDYQGLLSLASQAAPIQPAGIWTALTLNTGWTGGVSIFKDAVGVVHFKGNVTNATGGAATSIVTTTPLAAGFRPLANRIFSASDTVGTAYSVLVSSTGTIVTGNTVGNGLAVYLDGVSFLAEQ